MLPDTGLLRYGGFHINLAAGLEDSLISDISPPWNGKPSATETNKNTESGTQEIHPRQETSEPVNTITSSIKDNFILKVRTTYYNQGFFNVPIKHSNAFGADRDRIEIYCGKNQYLIQGYINRSVNINNTPRIMGGSALKQWFHENGEIDGSVIIDVLSPTSIWLRSQ